MDDTRLSLEANISEAYTEFGRGVVDGYLRTCADDFAFHVPAQSGIADTCVGREGIYSLAAGRWRSPAGPLANDNYAVVPARHPFRRRESGRRTYMRSGRGRLARCFEQSRDPGSFDEAWCFSIAKLTVS